MSGVALIFAAWFIEALIGWPRWLHRLIRHPVVWIGMLIRGLDHMLNRRCWSHTTRYVAGAVSSLFAISIATLLALLISTAPTDRWVGFLMEAAIASSLLASRSLYEHVTNVANPLLSGDIQTARQSVSLIVGRDPAQLDDTGIARASIESLAENTSDGIIAPLFWGVMFGLPGIAAYKAINTLDSMIGHRNQQYAAFGGFAARLDDLANLIPARLTGLLFAFASTRRSAFRVMARDARRHRSPNAGWPEAAMAGALDIRLSGPRIYNNQKTHDPWLNPAARDPSAQDIRRALKLYLKAMVISAVLLGALVLIQVMT